MTAPASDGPASDGPASDGPASDGPASDGPASDGPTKASDQTAGKVIIISGPSGAGKTTVVRRLLETCDLPLCLSVSATTRPPRPNETDGIDYFFLSPEEFAQKREAGDFLESFEVFGRGHWYGTLRETVATSLQQGNWVILEIDVQGQQQVIEQFPDAISIFVRPDSLEELEKRLRGRGTETEQTILRRLEVAGREWLEKDRYRFDVVNDRIEETVAEVCRLLEMAQD